MLLSKRFSAWVFSQGFGQGDYFAAFSVEEGLYLICLFQGSYYYEYCGESG